MTRIDLRNVSFSFSDLLWCTDTLGPSGERWRVIDLTFIEFERDSDATMFLLRL